MIIEDLTISDFFGLIIFMPLLIYLALLLFDGLGIFKDIFYTSDRRR
jgi:hypothetical protein